MAWYRKAAEQGNRDAQNNIGWFYQNGLGISRDYNEAESWYRKSAQQGSDRAKNNLAQLEQLRSGITLPVVDFARVCNGSSEDCITPPKPIFSPDPEYSRQALEAKYEGTCTLSLIVGTDGVPNQVRIVNGLGMGLDEKAIEMVKTWKFEPGMKEGKPVATRLMIQVDFRLGDTPR
jgi:TonB family protein